MSICDKCRYNDWGFVCQKGLPKFNETCKKYKPGQGLEIPEGAENAAIFDIKKVEEL